jgi:pimeloyl-ACP methyl ester carboxylesterase
VSDRLQNWLHIGRRESFASGVSLQVVDVGSGPDMLLLHGFPTWSYDWAEAAAVLAGDARIIAPDFLGYGLSDKPRRSYSIDEQADLVLALLSSRGICRVALVAHDFGVIVAQELLRRSQAGEVDVAFSSVSLLNAGIVFSEYRPTRAQTLLSTPVLGRIAAQRVTRNSLQQGLARVFGTRRPLDDAAFDEMWAGISHADGHRLADRLLHYNAERKRRHGVWEAALAAVDVPFALVWGLADPVSGAHVLTAARRAYPRARITELTHVGHFPQLEAPADVADAIRETARVGWSRL